jgi:hypothetical protein
MGAAPIERRDAADGVGANLVFCTEAGDYLSGDTIRDEFYAAVRAAGLGHLRYSCPER